MTSLSKLFLPGILFLIHLYINILNAQSPCTQFVGGKISQPDVTYRGVSLAVSIAGDAIYIGGIKNDSLLIIKRSLDAHVLWARTIEVTPGLGDNIISMLVDREGMIAISGVVGDNNFINGGSIFVVRYDPNNDQVLWSKTFTESIPRNFNTTIIQKVGTVII